MVSMILLCCCGDGNSGEFIQTTHKEGGSVECVNRRTSESIKVYCILYDENKHMGSKGLSLIYKAKKKDQVMTSVKVNVG